MVRYFTNTYSDLESGASVIELSHLTDLLRRTLDLVLKDEHARKDPSIYTGKLFYLGFDVNFIEMNPPMRVFSACSARRRWHCLHPVARHPSPD